MVVAGCVRYVAYLIEHRLNEYPPSWLWSLPTEN